MDRRKTHWRWSSKSSKIGPCTVTAHFTIHSTWNYVCIHYVCLFRVPSNNEFDSSLSSNIISSTPNVENVIVNKEETSTSGADIEMEIPKKQRVSFLLNELIMKKWLTWDVKLRRSRFNWRRINFGKTKWKKNWRLYKETWKIWCHSFATICATMKE